jgi:hypothetical protein
MPSHCTRSPWHAVVILAVLACAVSGCSPAESDRAHANGVRLATTIAHSSAHVDSLTRALDSARLRLTQLEAALAEARVLRVDGRWPTLVLYGATEAEGDTSSWQHGVAERARSSGWTVLRDRVAPSTLSVHVHDLPVQIDRDTMPGAGGLVIAGGMFRTTLPRAALEQCDVACLRALRGGRARSPSRS